MIEGLAALVLAGGAARRMGGGDKALMTVGGAAMLARVLAAIAPDAAQVAISANGDPARFAAFGVPVLDDGAFAGQGPLAGLLAGLDWAAGLGLATLLTVPGDTPFVPAGLAAALAPAPACAACGKRTHHLVALWPVAARTALRAQLAAPGPRGVGAFAAGIGMRTVDFPPRPWDPFLNVNTSADLATARAIAEEQA